MLPAMVDRTLVSDARTRKLSLTLFTPNKVATVIFYLHCCVWKCTLLIASVGPTGSSCCPGVGMSHHTATVHMGKGDTNYFPAFFLWDLYYNLLQFTTFCFYSL